MDLGVRGTGHIIVGGSRGMGLEVAKILAADGANIAIISRGASGAEAAESIAREYGVKAYGIVGDATNSESIDKAVDEAVDKLGGVKGLLCASAERKYGGLLDTSDEDWDYCFQSVVMGTVRACRAVVPHMIDGGGGSIVTIAAYSARSSKPYTIAYSSAKAMIVNISKNIARTYGEFNIRANCIAPGTIETERTIARLDQIMADRGVTRPEAEVIDFENFKMQVALNRVGQPQEVAQVMAFLLSDKASYATGVFLNVDGGTDF